MLMEYGTGRSKGFSLVELMIAIAILAILLGAAVPSFRTWLLNTQIRNASESILNGLQQARTEALTRNTNVQFALSADSGWEVKVVGGSSVATRSASEGSRKVNLVIAPAGSDAVTFDGTGAITANASGTPAVGSVTISSSAVSASESKTLKVTIGVGGNIRMCDPNKTSGPTKC